MTSQSSLLNQGPHQASSESRARSTGYPLCHSRSQSCFTPYLAGVAIHKEHIDAAPMPVHGKMLHLMASTVPSSVLVRWSDRSVSVPMGAPAPPHGIEKERHVAVSLHLHLVLPVIFLRASLKDPSGI